MNKKRLIFSSILCGLAITTLFLMFMPIVSADGEVMPRMFELATGAGQWVYVQEYVWGIGALIATICLPILIASSAVSILSACGVIKCKALDKALYILNIVLASFVVATIVNYTLGLGRTIGAPGFQLFTGPTFFQYSTAYYYLHCIFSIGALVMACLARTRKAK